MTSHELVSLRPDRAGDLKTDKLHPVSGYQNVHHCQHLPLEAFHNLADVHIDRGVRRTTPEGKAKADWQVQCFFYNPSIIVLFLIGKLILNRILKQFWKCLYEKYC